LQPLPTEFAGIGSGWNWKSLQQLPKEFVGIGSGIRWELLPEVLPTSVVFVFQPVVRSGSFRNKNSLEVLPEFDSQPLPLPTTSWEFVGSGSGWNWKWLQPLPLPTTSKEFDGIGSGIRWELLPGKSLFWKWQNTATHQLEAQTFLTYGVKRTIGIFLTPDSCFSKFFTPMNVVFIKILKVF